jgi:hemoglobin
MTMTQKAPYELLGGEKGVRQLVCKFYQTMDKCPEAKTIRDMHKESLEEIEEKLFEYLSGWLGGPGLYHEKYGSVCLTAPHKGYDIDEAARDQWLMCMNEALDNVGASEELKAMLKQPLFNIADMIRN